MSPKKLKQHLAIKAVFKRVGWICAERTDLESGLAYGVCRRFNNPECSTVSIFQRLSTASAVLIPQPFYCIVLNNSCS
jgi:hypothetical protein